MILQINNDTVEYKGHRGTFEVDWENKQFHGRLLDINAIDVYGGSTMKEFEEAFVEAVEDAIEDGFYADDELLEM